MARLSRTRRAVLGAAVLALPLGLLPLAAASAVTPPTPVFSYIDASDPNYAQVLSSANADGSGPTALTPAGYQTISFDATQDGQTELIGLCDRIIVLRESRVTGEVAGAAATEQALLALALGSDSAGCRSSI